MAKEKILVVEDERLVAEDIKDTVLNLGYTISSVVNTGEEAVEKAASSKPDLVLMDIVLKGKMNGVDAAKQIKAQLDIPVVYVTAHTDKATLKRAIETEPFGYVVKPFTEREVHSAIEMALYKSRAEKRIRHLNSVLRAIRNVNQLIARERDLDKLLTGICENLIETKGYLTCWIALTDPSGRFRAVAQAGIGDRFLPMIAYLKKGNMPQCMKKAIEKPEVVRIDHPAMCRGCPLSTQEFDGGSVTLRLEYGGKVYGVLCAYTPLEYLFDEEHQDLSEEVVSDIALALYSIELQQERRKMVEALENSEARYRLLAENASDIIWTTDLSLYLTYVTPSVTRMLGYSTKEVFDLTLEELFAPDSVGPARQAFKKELAAEKSGQSDPSRSLKLELEYSRKDGSTLWCEVNASFLRDPEGQPLGVVGITRDISKAREARENLRRMTSEIKGLINAANAPIFGINTKGQINEWNRAAERVTGYNKDEVIGKNLVEEFITKDYKASVTEVFLKALEGKDTANFELPLYAKHGRRVMIFLNATARRNFSGDIVGVMGVGQDITELTEYREGLEKKVTERTRELNRALYETEEARDRIDGILKSMADGLIVTDTYGRVITMNRGAEELLGIRLSEVVERPIDFAIQENTLRKKIKKTLQEKERGVQFDFELPKKHGKHPRIIRARTSMIVDKNGKERGIITIMHDVTYEREVDRMKSEFISTAAHQLRTPLTSIQGFSEILLKRDNIGEQEKKKFLSYINRQAKSLAMIISDLLDISRIESTAGFTVERTKCDPSEIIKSVISYFQKAFPRHTIEHILPDRPVALLADSRKIEQALQNIIDNAVNYSHEESVIRVRAEAFEDYYQVSVEDQGIGITPENLKKIFEKFYRVDNSDSAPEGTGLGMTIVKEIIEAHEGKVWVESEYGKGTKVAFTIPRK